MREEREAGAPNIVVRQCRFSEDAHLANLAVIIRVFRIIHLAELASSLHDA
jgi:hypothetical protein